MVNGFFQQPLTHRDGRLGWVRLIKSPSCNCRGCSLLACLLCQTCGGCRRHMLCQTTEREREEGREKGEGISEDESVRGTRLGWKETLSYIMSVLTGCFPQWNIELLERTCCRGVATLEIAELWILWYGHLSLIASPEEHFDTIWRVYLNKPPTFLNWKCSTSIFMAYW